MCPSNPLFIKLLKAQVAVLIVSEENVREAAPRTQTGGIDVGYNPDIFIELTSRSLVSVISGHVAE